MIRDWVEFDVLASTPEMFEEVNRDGSPLFLHRSRIGKIGIYEVV